MKYIWMGLTTLLVCSLAEASKPDNKSIVIMSAGLVEMAKVDGTISDSEKKLIGKELPLEGRLNPVDVFTMSHEDLPGQLSELNLNEKQQTGFIRFLALIALEDGTIHESEKALIKKYISRISTKTSVEGIIKSAKTLQTWLRDKEINKNLRSIALKQQSRADAGQDFIAANPYPTPGKEKKEWIPENSGGFMVLGWSPKADEEGKKQCQGTYWIEATKDDFSAFGIIDIDGDGGFATYTATLKNPSPKRITPVEVQ